jgi:hypothetical protein
MAEAVNRRPLTSEAQVRYQVSVCEICGEQSGTRIGFSPSISVFFPCQYHSTNAPYSSSSTCCSYQKGKDGKHENLPKSIVKYRTENPFHFVFSDLKHLTL